MQLDSEEDGPPLMPAGVVADSEPKSDAQLRREAAKAQLEAEAGHDDDDQEPSLSGTTVRESEEVPRNSSEAAFDDSRASEAEA